MFDLIKEYLKSYQFNDLFSIHDWEQILIGASDSFKIKHNQIWHGLIYVVNNTTNPKNFLIYCTYHYYRNSNNKDLRISKKYKDMPIKECYKIRQYLGLSIDIISFNQNICIECHKECISKFKKGDLQLK